MEEIDKNIISSKKSCYCSDPSKWIELIYKDILNKKLDSSGEFFLYFSEALEKARLDTEELTLNPTNIIDILDV